MPSTNNVYTLLSFFMAISHCTSATHIITRAWRSITLFSHARKGQRHLTHNSFVLSDPSPTRLRIIRRLPECNGTGVYYTVLVYRIWVALQTTTCVRRWSFPNKLRYETTHNTGSYVFSLMEFVNVVVLFTIMWNEINLDIGRKYCTKMVCAIYILLLVLEVQPVIQ